MSNVQTFRIKDTRFRAIQRRDGSFILYSATKDGTPSWWFCGYFATKDGRGGYRAAAQKKARTRPLRPVRENPPSETHESPTERFTGALQRARIRRFEDE